MDCHIFNLGVTLFYSVLLAFSEKQSEMQKETEKDLLISLFQNLKKEEYQAPMPEIKAEAEQK